MKPSASLAARIVFWMASVLLACLGAPDARAHESWPALLELREKSGDQFEVLWRTPLTAGLRSPIGLQLPDTWVTVGTPTEREQEKWIVQRFTVAVPRTQIDGATLRFPRQEGTITDIHVRLTRSDGTVFSTVVRPTDPRVELRGERSWWVNMREYVALGFHHIVLGVDHLLFVLGLLLIVRGRMMLLKTITAFTLAHSLTLAVATLGFASVPLEPLNAAIALSILFLGPEVVRAWRGETSLTIRFPWIVAFAFGLLHGFGFATGLSTAGVPAGELPWALLFFNIGVELGQLAFVALCFALVRAWRILEVSWPAWALRVPGYVVGVCGAYWTIQRVVIMFAAR
jgi:hydrogenase/urease accessory protein HupE